MRVENLEATLKLGEIIGKNLRGSEVIELVSDIGGGKTMLVHGIAKGAGSDDPVASPTFTLSREYKAGELTIEHYDFYRLDDPGIMSAELAESVGDDKTTVIIEWANIVEGVLPDNRATIEIKVGGTETSRIFSLNASDNLSYLFEGIS